MRGPVDPNVIFGRARLPKPRSYEDWRNRLVCRLFGRVSREDFDFAFETACTWMKGRSIDTEQARFSAFDIVYACTGVPPGVIIQTCEETSLIMMTVTLRGHVGEDDGADTDAAGMPKRTKVQHTRTRIVDLTPAASGVVPFKKKA